MTAINPPADRTAAIRARLGAATEGPWIYESAADIHGVEDDRIHYVTPKFAARDDDPPMTSFYDRADAELVANAPADLAYLLSENDRLNAEVESLRTQLDAAASAIREKHRPLSNGGFGSRKTFVCDGHESWLDWPCPEARRVYTEEEIQQALGGADDEH